jgi:hypothetical protein
MKQLINIKHFVFIVASIVVIYFGYAIKRCLQKKCDIAEVLSHRDYLQIHVTKNRSNIENFFLSEKGKTSVRRRGEFLSGICILIDEDLSAQDAIPILKVFKDGGVRNILIMYADRQVKSDSSNISMSKLNVENSGHNFPFHSIYDKVSQISVISDNNLLRHFAYTAGRFPIEICYNLYKLDLFSYNYVRFEEPFEITCFLRLWDNEEAKKRECDVLSESETIKVLKSITSNIRRYKFSYPVVVRDSWTGKKRYVITTFGKIIQSNPEAEGGLIQERESRVK